MPLPRIELSGRGGNSGVRGHAVSDPQWRARRRRSPGVRHAHPAELLTWQEQLREAVSEHDETRATTITAASLDAAIDRVRASMNNV